MTENLVLTKCGHSVGDFEESTDVVSMYAWGSDIVFQYASRLANYSMINDLHSHRIDSAKLLVNSFDKYTRFQGWLGLFHPVP